MWDIEVTDQFDEWWSTLTDDQREAVTDRVDVLAERGPDLGRPIVDRIHSSRHQSMKELRAAKGGALRVLFCFDRVDMPSCCSAATRLVLGMSGTSGRSRSPMICTTNISTNLERKD